MIHLQIVAHTGSGLFGKLKEAMGSGDLKTLIPMKRGRKVVHKSYPGWMNWSHQGDVILCDILSPKKPGQEWQLLRAFVGRLADREAASIHSINIQFPDEMAAPGEGGRRSKRVSRGRRTRR